MRRTAFLAALFASVAFVEYARAEALRTVALSGQPAPGAAAGVVYDNFASYNTHGVLKPLFRGPVLNDAGQVAFRANVVGDGVDFTNHQGVWSEGSGSLALVARTGSQAPGAPLGMNFGTYVGLELFTPVINNAGQIAFYGALANGNLGLWSEGSGSLTVVAREGLHSPALPAGVNFSFAIIYEENKWLFTDFPLLNDAGQTSFYAGLAGTGVNGTNNAGTWVGLDAGNLATLARRGNPAAGLPASVTYADGQLATSLNNAGQASFLAYLETNGFVGIWSGAPGSLAPIARDGTPAPGTPNGASFRDFFAPLAFNGAGQIAFEAWITGGDVVEDVNDEGLWTNASGSLQLAVRRGSQAAGLPMGLKFGTFDRHSYPLLNDAGQLAFHAAIEGAGIDESNNDGIWLGAPGDLALVARLGDQAPDAPSGVNFSDLHYPALNAAGQIAFRANLTGDGVDPSNDRGIWASDLSGTLQLLVRTGDALEVSPGDVRTLANLDFVVLSGNGDGRRSAFNNHGQLAFWASFTDGSQGVFVSDAVAHIPGDFNHDGAVDAADLAQWKGDFGLNGNSDADGDGDSDGADFLAWQRQLGAGLSAIDSSTVVPEPRGLVLLVIAVGAALGPRSIASFRGGQNGERIASTKPIPIQCVK